MNPDAIRQHCDTIDAATAAIRAELDAPPPPEGVTIGDGGDLQAGLNGGGQITLAAGATFTAPGGYVLAVDGTALVGTGANVVAGESGAAISVVPGVHQTAVECLGVRSGDDGAALQVGRNDGEQITVVAAPGFAVLRVLSSTSHRGKRAIELNARDVEVLDCEVYDCWDPAGRDSQAIWLGNCPGPVRIVGGYFEGGSENLMVGGDTMKIPDCRPTGIAILGATFIKPLAWQAAGTPKVKNLLELKDGHDVLIEDCDLAQCWKSGQDGYAFMFTPANGGSLRNVVVRNCRVRDVGGIVNVTGTDAAGINAERTQVSILGGDYRTNKAAMGGTGRFLLATRGPESLIVEDATIAHEGSTFLELGDTAPVDVLRIARCTWNYGSYGIRIGGANHGDNAQGIVAALQITGNVITGAHAAFRERYPDNTYLENMRHDREVDVDRRAAAHAREVVEELRRVRQWETGYRV